MMIDEKLPLPGLTRGLEILSLLGASPEGPKRGMSFSAIQKQLDLPSPTLSRILKVLLASKWLSNEAEGRYATGPRFYQLISGTRDFSYPIQQSVDRLSARTRESAAFARDGESGFYFIARHLQAGSGVFIEAYQANSNYSKNGFGMLLKGAPSREVLVSFDNAGTRIVGPVHFGGRLYGGLGISSVQREPDVSLYRGIVMEEARQLEEVMMFYGGNSNEEET